MTMQHSKDRGDDRHDPEKERASRMNEEGLKKLKEILNDPTSRVFTVPEEARGYFRPGYHIHTQEGKGLGVYFHPDHYFDSFREPLTEEQLEELMRYDNAKLNR